MPSLQQLVVRFLVDNIDDVGGFGVLSPAILHSLAAQLAERRKFTVEVRLPNVTGVLE